MQYSEIDVAVSYHEPSLIFASDALKPMQLGKATAEVDLGMRGDDTGDNISARNRFYAECTAFWWIWKNSPAAVKGCLHGRRLLDLTRPGEEAYTAACEDIKNPAEFAAVGLGLNSRTISALLAKADILTGKKADISRRFRGSIAEHFKSAHVPHHWDLSMEIVKRDFPQIYPTVLRVTNGTLGYFHNQVIMKAELFDAMCEFCFHITERLSGHIDETRPEFNDGWRYTASYLTFVWERMSGAYLEYLAEKGNAILEFPSVLVTPRVAPEAEARALKPVFDGNAVAIMLATDDNYTPYCAVMLQSLKEHAAENRNYDIVVASRDMPGRNKRLLEAMGAKNVSIRVVDVTGFMGGVDLSVFKTNAHFSLETYYRFFIPKIFAAYDKILYLDVDMVALRDVAELYDTDIGDNWWGAAYDKFIPASCSVAHETWATKKFRPYIADTLRMDSLYDYFQAGVMIWNVHQCIKDNVMEQCLKRLAQIGSPIFVDQCVMNSVANGKHIFWLSPYWNVAWNAKFEWQRDCCDTESYKTSIYLAESPHIYIMHYCGHIKPWNYPWRDNSVYFWQYARKTPFYEKILCEFISNNIISYSKISELKRKIWQYKILQFFTFGLAKKITRKKRKYRGELRAITEAEAA